MELFSKINIRKQKIYFEGIYQISQNSSILWKCCYSFSMLCLTLCDPMDCSRQSFTISCPPSSGSRLSVPELRQQSPQQAPRLGAMTALPSVLYPTLQLLLSEDTYCMVSLCPFRFLGLRLATPSA